jgi:ubiquinone/menaquinone biosynthesis C-methylase UbiE
MKTEKYSTCAEVICEYTSGVVVKKGTMTTSRSFDQAAEYYDNTRPLFGASADVGIQSLLDAVGVGARILEVGTGTGRIAIPMLERGADLIGCDLSSKMLLRQREKFPAARLAQSDAVHLPFPSAHFDAVLIVHVMHLIGPWREALREFKRVLRAGGILLSVGTNATVGESIRNTMREHWRGWLEAHGADTRHPGSQNKEETHAELLSMGASLKEVEAVRFALPFTLRGELDRYASRVFSDTWSVPDELYQASLDELRDWAVREYGDLDSPREDTVRFVFDVASFDASAK